jgi:hypothetical protein
MLQFQLGINLCQDPFPVGVFRLYANVILLPGELRGKRGLFLYQSDATYFYPLPESEPTRNVLPYLLHLTTPAEKNEISLYYAQGSEASRAFLQIIPPPGERVLEWEEWNFDPKEQKTFSLPEGKKLDQVADQETADQLRNAYVEKHLLDRFKALSGHKLGTGKKQRQQLVEDAVEALSKSANEAKKNGNWKNVAEARDNLAQEIRRAAFESSDPKFPFNQYRSALSTCLKMNVPAINEKAREALGSLRPEGAPAGTKPATKDTHSP